MGKEFLIHKQETPEESQKILDANRVHFSKQCRILFQALMRGEVLNTLNVVNNYHISDWRRRCCDLRGNGVKLTWAPAGDGRTKNWYMATEDIKYNQKFNK